MPPGPADKCDLHTTEDSFYRVAELLKEYGDVSCLHSAIRQSNSYLVNHPDYVKHILVNNHQNYNKGPGFERVKMLLGNGIIVSDGVFWRRQRRMIQPGFSRQIIARMMEDVKACNLRLLDDWLQKAANNAVIDITEEMSELSLEIILRVLLADDYDRILEEHGENPFSILTQDPSRDMKLVLKYRALTGIIQDTIDHRRAHPVEGEDFLSSFMAAVDKDSGEPMTDKELIDEVMTLIVAGHETSAGTLNWAWYLLAQHPAEMQKLYDEIDACGFDDIPEFEQLESLPYARQVLDETLRLYPPVWLFTRKAIHDDKIGDYDVPAGTDIFITPYYLHRHPDFWDEPEAFHPERFTDEAVKARHKFVHIPFSAGPRRCIGDYFAMVEMQMHLAMIAKKISLELVAPQTLELAPDVNLRSKQPFEMRLSLRH